MTRLIVASLISLFAAGCSCTTQHAAPGQQPAAGDQAAKQDGEQPAGNPVAAAPANNPQLKSRFGNALLQQLDKADGGSNEDHDAIRDTLKKNDPYLERALDEDLHRKIDLGNGVLVNEKIEMNNNTQAGQRRIYIPPP